jgi:hypothetical protein
MLLQYIIGIAVFYIQKLRIINIIQFKVRVRILDALEKAEKYGIKIEGQNKWITLIQNAKNI